MPAGAQIFLTIFLWALFAGYMIVAARSMVRTKDDTFMILCLGALAAFIAEPFTCFMVKACYPPVGQYSVIYYFWRHIPLFIPAAYGTYMPVWAYFIIRTFKQNPTPAVFWKFVVCLWVFAFAFEVGPINAGLWFYFGTQPFVLLGFPLYESFVNTTLVMAFSATALICLELLSGPKRYLFLVLSSMAFYAEYASTTWPIAAALHSGSPIQVTQLAALATVILSLLEAYIILQVMTFIVTRRTTAALELTAPLAVGQN